MTESDTEQPYVEAWARATVHLPGGIYPGEVYLVDISSVYVQECIEAGALVLVGSDLVETLRLGTGPEPPVEPEPPAEPVADSEDDFLDAATETAEYLEEHPDEGVKPIETEPTS